MNKLIIAFLLTLLASHSIFSQAGWAGEINRSDQLATEKRIALIIGNRAYKDSPLLNPVNDAKDMAQALTELQFEVIYKENITQREMKEAIRAFGERIRGGGVGLFYFAGHGAQVNGENYLIPVDATIAKEEEIEYESVNVGLILAQVVNSNNRVNIIILDACRNNPFARSFRSETRGLAIINAPSGVIIAYATAPGSIASDGDKKNGLYTSELLRAIRISGLRVEEVFKRTRAAVREKTSGKQIPWESSSLIGDFYFISPSGKALSGVDSTLQPIDEFKELETSALNYAAKIREVPLAASMYEKELQRLIAKLRSHPEYEKKSPRTSALIYRTYAATLLFNTATRKNPSSALDFAFPWLQRSVETGTHFKDYKDLKAARDFIRNILENQPPSVEMRPLLQHQFIIAMIEANAEEVEKQVEAAFEVIKAMVEARDSNQQKKLLTEIQAAALELGIAMGSKLGLVLLPVSNRGKSFAEIEYSIADLTSFMNRLDFKEPQTKSVFDNVEKAMSNNNSVTAANKILQEINRIKDTLESKKQSALMRTFRIGFFIGYFLETGSVAMTLNPTDQQVIQYSSAADPYRSTINADIALCGLPSGIVEAIKETNIELKTVNDLRRMIGASRKVFQIIKSKARN